MKKNLFVLLLFCVNFAFAQLNETFDDGNFLADPAWNGNTSAFLINSNKQLQTAVSSSSQVVTLSTPNNLIHDVSWQFYLQMDFDPSTQNQVRIYLISDKEDLTGSLNGYFIQVGESLNTDSYDLYKQTGTTIAKIIDGHPKARTSTNQVKAAVRVTRDIYGNWTLQTAIDGSTDFITEGTVNDVSFTPTSFFGVHCRYTATNSAKFIFDDFSITPFAQPTERIAPKLLSVLVKDATTLELSFDKVLKLTTAENVLNYQLNNGFGHPLAISTSAGKILLKFDKPFTNGDYLLTLNYIEDLIGTPIAANTTSSFQYKQPYIPQKKDLVINEIFADPSPQIDLPTVEFIELFNTTDHTIYLSKWKYSDPSAIANLPADSIKAGEFIILCAKADTNEFKRFGKVIGISPWPSLNNSGDIIKITSPENLTIDSVSYTDGWYKNATKKQGGWTLERVDPLSTCEGIFNWNASVDPTGGTPGKVNSIYHFNYDGLALLADSISIASDSTLIIHFNKPVDATTLSLTNFNLNPSDGKVKSIKLDHQNQKPTLVFSTKFIPGAGYVISISGISDCSGKNQVDANTRFNFSIPALPLPTADTAKILITEIFADPSPEVGLPLVEFVEIYNPGKDTVDLHNWTLNDPATKGIIKNTKIAPQQYIILCPAADTSQYQSFGKTVALSPWPSLNNASDQITLKSAALRLVDSVSYADSWYNDAVKKQGGWSLELIDLQASCSGAGNWTASIDPKGGTPGSQNSVFKINTTADALKIVAASLEDSTTIRVRFNRALDLFTASLAENYMLNDIGKPKSVILASDQQTVDLKYSPRLPGGTYRLSVTNLTDCAGSVIAAQNASISMFVPEQINKGDILISEILFNPRPGGVDFVEIYNNSNKQFDIKDLSIGTIKELDSLTGMRQISNQSILFKPGQYLAITTDPENIQKEYDVKYPEALVKIASLPAFNDDKGSVVLSNGLTRIDQFSYTEKMHFSLLKQNEGVSLERSSFSNPANQPGNFRSAASTAGYATPGYKNSQSLEQNDATEEISFLSKTFSPDNDGFEDVLSINYKFAEPGLMASISVYNDKGLLIKRLFRNSTLAAEGNIIWDGINENGHKAETGIYVLYFEAFNASGQVKKYRKNFVLASRLH